MRTTSLTAILLACCVFAACDMVPSDNGHLDGNWQLRRIDTLATGGSCDMSQSYVYWAVEGDLLQVRDIDNSNLKLLFRFQREGENLRLHSPHQALTKDDVRPLESTDLLLPLGITTTDETFLIHSLNSSEMVLSNGLYKMSFRKH